MPAANQNCPRLARNQRIGRAIANFIITGGLTGGWAYLVSCIWSLVHG